MNHLYYGDNLDVLRRYVADESVDLVYLDPPFKSDQNYNVLFAEQDGSRSAAQIHAFEDTWRWDQSAAEAYQEVVEAGGKVSEVMQAFRQALGDNDMLAYLCMMAPRLIELRRTLKKTGSLYLHCDPTASHYLKLLMDSIFAPVNFRNEIIWLRTLSKGLMTKRLPNNHDVVLTYQKSDGATWNPDSIFTPYDEDNLDPKTDEKYRQRDPDGRRYQLDNLINPNPDRPNLTYEFLGITKVWRWTKARMQKAYEDGLVVQPSPGSVPRLKRYLDEQRGKPFGDVWVDIPPLNSQAAERLGYPTQKPEALLERILLMSSNEGDVVLDPFCGCGTTIAAAQKLKRNWMGIDVTHLAVGLIKHRLHDSFGLVQKRDYEVVGEPTDIGGAQELARTEPHDFQAWALGLVNARTDTSAKKGADKGIDGRLIFHDEDDTRHTKQIILSVKAGHTSVPHVRDLRGVLDREKAQIGVLISMEEPTKPMRAEAAGAGFYRSPFTRKDHPRIQLLTIEELLGGKQVDMPPVRQTSQTFKKAPKAKAKKSHRQKTLGESDE